MAQTIRARLTPREGRKFALTVGAAFLLLAAISRWRGHHTAPWILGTLGALLLAAGALLPGRLTPLYRGWMRFGLALSKVTTPIFMGLLYFVVLTPTGFVMRLFGRNPLKARETEGSFWLRRPARNDETESLTRQF
ncbi:MAG TPA: SxtJ family membrane protein [Gemmatimonadales bacterium]|nr:SxtJ family membrane protein [Gemmatimonadales bacterium]